MYTIMYYMYIEKKYPNDCFLVAVTHCISVYSEYCVTQNVDETEVLSSF